MWLPVHSTFILSFAMIFSSSMVDSPERPRRNAANQEYQTLTYSFLSKYAHAGRHAGHTPHAVRVLFLIQRFPLHSNASPILASLKYLRVALLRCRVAGVSISIISLCVPGVLDFVASRFLDDHARIGHVVRRLVHVVKRAHPFRFAHALAVHVVALDLRRAPKRLCLN